MHFDRIDEIYAMVESIDNLTEFTYIARPNSKLAGPTCHARLATETKLSLADM